MDENIKWLNQERIFKTIKALKQNRIEGHLVRSREELKEKIKDLVKDGSLVACGGSMTLMELGIIDFLQNGNYEYLDRYKKGLSEEEVKALYRKSFSADAYFTSSNAITETGEIYNVDGNGNRVAAMLYGPDKVIIIAGVNKIVKNLDAAIERNRRVSAPANSKRLQRETPCSKVGYCVDCESAERICCEYTLIKKQKDKHRMHVIFLNEDLGY